jgi:hypothetical protein
MPVQIITHTIKSSGGDYSVLSTWEAAQQRDLTSGTAISGTITGTDGQIEKAECYNFDETGGVIINGWTTTASNYVWFMSPTGERHDGRPRDTSASGFRTRSAAGSGYVVGVNPSNHVKIEGIEIGGTSTISGRNAVRCLTTVTSTDGMIEVSECLLWTISGGGAPAVRANTNPIKLRLRNSMIWSDSVGIDASNATDVKVISCTVVRAATTTATGSGVILSPGTYVVNTYAGAYATQFQGTGSATQGVNNASSDTSATLRFGTTAVSNLAATGQFVAVATFFATTFDLHLVSTSGLIDAGSSTTTATLDIDGDSRS